MALRADIALQVANAVFNSEEHRRALLLVPRKRTQVYVTNDDNVLHRPPRSAFIELGAWRLMNDMTVSLVQSAEIVSKEISGWNHVLTTLGRNIAILVEDRIASEAQLRRHSEQFTSGQIWADRKKRSEAEYIFIIHRIEYTDKDSVPFRIHGRQIITTTENDGYVPEDRDLHPHSLAEMAPHLWFNPVIEEEIEDK